MKQSGAVGHFSTFRHSIKRLTFAVLVIGAFGLMILGKADVLLGERLRLIVVDTMTPVLGLVARPMEWLSVTGDTLWNMTHIYEENERLRRENSTLLRWQIVSKRLLEENAVLGSMLNVAPDPDATMVTARVIADLGSAFGHSVLLGAGSNHGIRKGQIGLVGEALAGHIVEVSDQASRMLLLADITSRIPVVVLPSNANAVLMGDNQHMPRLGHLLGNPAISVGDTVVTSALGGAFPPGIPVGRVQAIQDGVMRVRPFTQQQSLDYVTVADYGLGGLLSADIALPSRPARRQ